MSITTLHVDVFALIHKILAETYGPYAIDITLILTSKDLAKLVFTLYGVPTQFRALAAMRKEFIRVRTTDLVFNLFSTVRISDNHRRNILNRKLVSGTWKENVEISEEYVEWIFDIHDDCSDISSCTRIYRISCGCRMDVNDVLSHYNQANK